ncbi:hypothetical protein [Tolumonas lignilytica]|jgi:hypothetical protein|nr:hypothetical protein [Tolumonas lignilytica]
MKAADYAPACLSHNYQQEENKLPQPRNLTAVISGYPISSLI